MYFKVYIVLIVVIIYLFIYIIMSSKIITIIKTI